MCCKKTALIQTICPAIYITALYIANIITNDTLQFQKQECCFQAISQVYLIYSPTHPVWTAGEIWKSHGRDDNCLLVCDSYRRFEWSSCVFFTYQKTVTFTNLTFCGKALYCTMTMSHTQPKAHASMLVNQHWSGCHENLFSSLVGFWPVKLFEWTDNTKQNKIPCSWHLTYRLGPLGSSTAKN